MWFCSEEWVSDQGSGLIVDNKGCRGKRGRWVAGAGEWCGFAYAQYLTCSMLWFFK